MAMTNTKAAALFIAAGMIVTAGIAVPIIISKVPPAPVALPATRPTTNPDAWKARFHEMYALKPGEIAKRIEQPYIPERRDYFKSLPQEDVLRDDPPDSSLFRWFDGTAHISYATMSVEEPLMLADLMMHSADVWPQDTDLSREVLMMDVRGDWIVRDEATQEEKVSAVFQATMGPGMALKLTPMERDVIVVTGHFEYRPVSNSKTRLISDGKRMLGVLLFSNYDRVEADGRQIAQTQTEFLMLLCEMFNQPIVVEAELGEKKSIEMLMTRNVRSYLRSKQPMDEVSMNEILDLVSQQTSLQFTKARRTVPTWKVTQADK